MITSIKTIIRILTMLLVGTGFYHSQLTQTENYVYSKTILSTPEDPDPKDTLRTVTYFDGLGRPKQTIMINGGGTANTDLVTPFVYDGFGRQVLDVLPIPMETSSKAIHPGLNENSGSSFYGARPYAEKILESSPLDRIQQQIQPGTDWQSHPVNYAYQTNTGTDVLKFTTTTLVSGDAFYTATLNVNGYYAASKLYKKKVSDEDGSTTYEFKNGEGQTLLVRKVIGNESDLGQGLAPQPTTQYLDTYYVYNEYNQLAFVIPPLASVEFRNNSSQSITDPRTASNSTLDNLCYQYNYDGRNRLVEKKLPGKGWESMVYDKADRLILTQDANMAPQWKWLFTKYDQLGRVIYTGIVPGSTRQELQTVLGSLNIIESPDATGFSKNGLTAYYSNNMFPYFEKLLSVNYYDTYPTGTPFPDNNTIQNQQILTSSYDSVGRSTQSLPLASYVKNINDDVWTRTYTYYDNKGRTIGTTSINHLGGKTRVEMKLDFAGVVQKTETWHNKTSQESPIRIVEDFKYDGQNRLLKHYHEVVGKSPKELLADNTYDALGRLVTKKVGAVSDANFTEVSPALQTISYDYNIRGWMTGINLNQADSSRPLDKTRLFSYKIRYNDPVNTLLRRYNGNISEVDWVYGDNDISRYEYSYDDVNRLTKANYKSLDVTGTKDSQYYNEQLTYDANGNILTLKRNARPQRTGQSAVQIDDLTYEYENSSMSNRLSTVYDNAQNSSGYPAVTAAQPMTYDLNGNMTSHLDKEISEITYNYLNLPEQVIQSGNPVNYTYRADGVKVHKQYVVNGQNIDTDYLDGFVYTTPYTNELQTALLENPEMADGGQPEAFELGGKVVAVGPGGGGPQQMPESTPNFFATAEGFYDYDNLRYIYQYKDHLGNVRLSYSRDSAGDLSVESSNDYYPFGLNFVNITPRTAHPVYNPSVSYENWKYNGKELEETGMYDYGARMYMSDIGRWGVVDRLSEFAQGWSPYRYAYDNPVKFYDPTGLFEQGGDPDPNKVYKGGDIEEVVITKVTHLPKMKPMEPTFGSTLQDLRNRPYNPAMGAANAGKFVFDSVLDIGNALRNFMGFGRDKSGPAGERWTNLDGSPMGGQEQQTQAVNMLVTLFGGMYNLAAETSSIPRFSGTEKAWQSGATPNSVYTYLSADGETAVSNYIYNAEGKVSFQVDFQNHGIDWLSGHGHNMSIPGKLGSGHLPENHILHNLVPTDYKIIPPNTTYSVPLAK